MNVDSLPPDQQFKTPQRNSQETNMRKIVASNSTERSTVFLYPQEPSYPCLRLGRPFLFNIFLLFLEDDVDAPRLMNPLQMSGVRWFGFLLFQLFPSICAFWSVIIISSNLYFQSNRSPILRNCCAHSTAAVCSFFAISDSIDTLRVLSGFSTVFKV